MFLVFETDSSWHPLVSRFSCTDTGVSRETIEVCAMSRRDFPVGLFYVGRNEMKTHISEKQDDEGRATHIFLSSYGRPAIFHEPSGFKDVTIAR